MSRAPSLPAVRPASANGLEGHLRHEREPALDGVRGWAAAMVFWSHSAGFHVWGGTGFWLFFILSGFLLFRPFVRSGYRLEGRGLIGYGVRRLLRIWPLLLVAVPLYAMAVPEFGGWRSALAHSVLIQADMHFWTVKQELLFYAVLPLFVVLCRIAPRHAFGVLVACGVGGYVLFDVVQIVSIPWQGLGLKLRIVPFIIGMALAAGLHRVGPRAGRALFWAGAIGLWALSSSVLFSLFHRDPGYFEWEHPYLLWPFLAAAMAGAYAAPSALVTHPVVRQIGVWGYGIYIWHFGVLLVLKSRMDAPLWATTLLAAAVTLVLAAASYRWIEAPAIAWGQRLTRRLRGA
ncbi:acyltransferase family protein [Xylophilus sp. ASV27]|uniref:acyltransferase family protein n=1 Tax=Xylophilus sp. ASV27 TaxID=2795129 RepID=UPI0018EC58A1|nr:acyltransferase [Xylophilus sp. ASV27]